MTTTKNPSVLFVINSLVAGGAEHVLKEVAEGLLHRNYEVHVLTLQDHPDFYKLDPGIVRHRLGVMHRAPVLLRAFALISRILTLRRAIEAIAPDCVVSFMDRVNVFVIPAAGKRPVIISERNNPAMGTSGFEVRLLRRILYHRADRVVSVSQGVSDSLHWVPESLKTVIYNPLKQASSGLSMPFAPSSDRKYLTAIGRLSHQKGFDTLLEAFSAVANRLPEWDLVIYGEGYLRERLTATIREYHLQDRVFLPGLAPTDQALKLADCFILSSRFEGFPNVLIEAMQAGLPIVATDCTYGTAEIIESGSNGILVPPEDHGALATAIPTVCTAPE